MIRLIVDKLSDGHKDIFLKFDSAPTEVKIIDSYYLSDFLEITDTELESVDFKKMKEFEYREIIFEENPILIYVAKKLIDFWIERIKEIKKGETRFIPFDLSDEYIGGLLLEKNKLGFIIKQVYTTKIQGCEGLRKSNLDDLILERDINFDFEKAEDRFISEDALFAGLEWSKDRLTC
jgi:hypothetical protein